MPDDAMPPAPPSRTPRVGSVVSQHGAVYVSIDGELVPVSDSRAHGALAAHLLDKLRFRYQHGPHLPLLDTQALRSSAGFSALEGTEADAQKLGETLVEIGQLSPAVQAVCGNCRQVLGVFSSSGQAREQVGGLCPYCGPGGNISHQPGFVLTEDPRPRGARDVAELDSLPATALRSVVTARMSDEQRKAALNGSSERFWRVARDAGLIRQETYDQLAANGQLSRYAGD